MNNPIDPLHNAHIEKLNPAQIFGLVLGHTFLTE